MISALIPVYNTQVVLLVTELSRQLSQLNNGGEIIVFDDCSLPEFRKSNAVIKNLDNVRYEELEKNHGRTAIRQLLAASANYDWLLFLDNDSRILSTDFLQRYISVLNKDTHVFVGGRTYPSKPTDCEKRLHWKYGTKREAVKGSRTVLHTNNFCIRKEVFELLHFPDFLKGYGHEDTWMEIELQRLQKHIVHIANPVEHVHIETSGNFLNKTCQALQNLLLLEKVVSQKQLRKHVTLFKAYSRVRRFGLEFLINLFYRSFQKKIEENLHSCNPSLSVFDFYKLYHFIQLSKKGI